jgi:hypothetical protein
MTIFWVSQFTRSPNHQITNCHSTPDAAWFSSESLIEADGSRRDDTISPAFLAI